MDTTILALCLSSAVGAAVITQLGTLIINRLNRKDTEEDKADKKEDKITELENADSKIFEEIKSLAENLETTNEELKGIKETVNNMHESMGGIRASISDLSYRVEATAAVQSRVRILRFGDEILHNVSHSKEHFDQIMQDAKIYDDHCKKYPQFENNITQATIKTIKDLYQKLTITNGFLK